MVVSIAILVDSTSIRPDTRLLTELDLDSLKMLQVLESLKDRFGIDFLMPPHSLGDLHSIASVADAILQYNLRQQ
jgi:acyl carrier protein